MRKYLICSLLLAFSTLALYGCSYDRDAADHKPATAKVTDSDMENKIRAKFDADATLKAANLDIDANADRNEVTLTGTVESQALRTKAVEIAKNAYANVILVDKIDVKPRAVTRAEYTEELARAQRERAKAAGETIGSSLDDAWIHTKIVAQLIGDADTPQRKINVDVDNNVVTLRGTVDKTAEKAEAERIARTTEGVKSVRNQLKVAAAAKP